MKTYECFGDRVDLQGIILRRGARIELEESTGAALIENDIPIRPLEESTPAVSAEKEKE